MGSLEHFVADRLNEIAFARMKPLALRMDGGGRILDWWGEPDWYGFEPLRQGVEAESVLPFLTGITPDDVDHLPFMQTPGGRSIHVWLYAADGGSIVLLIDVTEEHDRHQRLQQQANQIQILSYEQQKLLAQLRAARDEIEEKRRLAEEANGIKSRFIASLSHELRTPLASIIGRTDWLLEGGPEGSGARDDLAAIDANARHLLSLIENILDQAKIESGQLRLNPGPLSPRGLWLELGALFAPLARERGLRFHTVLGDGVPEAIAVDGLRLRQVIINLVNNAMKYTPRGSVSLRGDWDRDRFQVTVEDTGIGMQEEDRKKIFHPFFQKQGGRVGARTGVGLGLSISRELVGLMGGVIEVSSVTGQGSRFSFSAQAPRVAPRPADHQDVAARADPSRARATANIVLADDSEDLLLIMERFVRREGFAVHSSDNGAQLLDLVREHQPAAVFLDLYLGEESGSELAAELREGGYRGVIIALSASSLEEDRERALSAGCDQYAQKPLKHADVKRLLASVVSPRH